MFKYIEYKKVKTTDTVLEFRGGDEEVLVTVFTGKNMTTNVVSISYSDATKADTLISSQPQKIGCTEISQTDFKALVKNSDQINSIRRQVKAKIAEEYSIEDEIAMLKKAETNAKRVAYQDYVNKCIAFGENLKAKVGY